MFDDDESQFLDMDTGKEHDSDIHCSLCGDVVENTDQPEYAALCDACVAYVNARFAPVND